MPRKDEAVVLTPGSTYRIRSLESRDKPMETVGMFKGYAAVAHDTAIVMELEKKLGSATPALESYYRARQGEYRLLRLAKRVAERPLPRARLVDMREEYAEQKSQVLLSRELVEAMRRALDGGGQVILFLNRRGFSTYIHCRRCGHVMRCANCDVALTSFYHRDEREARCHHCGRPAAAPEICPSCNGGRLAYFGSGTQRVEDVVGRLFPGVALARMDSDVTGKRGSHRRILDEFAAGKTRILLGTQMIGKGLDFPNVTLVGVISADVILNLPDFRAHERTFQLLTQVAGRAGRSERGGIALIQTSAPEIACIRHAARHDYETFAADELRHREAMGYPPFSVLARVVLSATDPRELPARARAISDLLRRMASPRTEIQGPMEAPAARLRGRYRWHFVIKARERAELARLFRLGDRTLRSSGKLRVIVDVDPATML